MFYYVTLYRTPLHFASSNANLMTVDFILKNGGNVDVKDLNGETPLFLASSKSLHVVRLLHNYGADVNSANIHERSPLHYAVESGVFDIVKYLVENGANVSYVDRYGKTPLFLSIPGNYSCITEYLLQKGSIVNCMDQNGLKPIHYASCFGCLEIIKLLILHGADIYEPMNNICYINMGKVL